MLYFLLSLQTAFYIQYNNQIKKLLCPGILCFICRFFVLFFVCFFFFGEDSFALTVSNKFPNKPNIVVKGMQLKFTNDFDNDNVVIIVSTVCRCKEE